MFSAQERGKTESAYRSYERQDAMIDDALVLVMISTGKPAAANLLDRQLRFWHIASFRRCAATRRPLGHSGLCQAVSPADL